MSNEEEDKRPTYTIEDNRILRHGEHVATYDVNTQVVEPVEGRENFLSASKKFLSEQGVEWKKVADQDEPEARDVTTKPQEGFTPPLPLPDKDGPAPDTDPELGTLTPAFMLWVLQNGQKEFEKRYAERKTPLGDFKNQKLDIDEVRKTYLGI